jgi:hypothetical protein
MICVWISFLGLSDWDRFSEPQGRSKWLLELASEPQWRSKWPLEEWWFPFVTGFSDCWLTPPLPHQPLPPAASASSTAEFLCAPPPSSPTIRVEFDPFPAILPIPRPNSCVFLHVRILVFLLRRNYTASSILTIP